MKHRIFAALALALFLPACADIQAVGSAVSVATNLSVPQKDVAAAVVAFDGAQDTASAYLQQPTCKVGQSVALNGCKTKKGVALLAKDVPAGRAARNSLWNASLGATAGVTSRSLLTAVIAATSALSADVKS